MQKLSNLFLPHHNPWITARVTFTMYWRSSFMLQIKRFFGGFFCFKKGNIFPAQNFDLPKCARITLDVNSQNYFIALGNISREYYFFIIIIIFFWSVSFNFYIWTPVTSLIVLISGVNQMKEHQTIFCIVFQVKCIFLRHLILVLNLQVKSHKDIQAFFFWGGNKKKPKQI